MNINNIMMAGLGCLIFLFIGWQFFLIVKYIFFLFTKPNEKHKFPWLALIIFLFCCGFYIIAFILDFSGYLQ